MFYLDPPGTRNGSLEIVDRNDVFHLLVSEFPQCVLFDSATLMHRAYPPSSGARPSIEVTTMPSMKTCTKCVFAGHAAMFPKHIDDGIAEKLAENQVYGDRPTDAPYPSQSKPTIPHKLLREIRRLPSAFKKIIGHQRRSDEPPLSSQLHLMLGGGPTFEQRGWINLDPVGGPNNRFPFVFSGNCTFPIPSGMIQTVYLNNSMIPNRGILAQTLREVRRVILDNGDLLVKLDGDDHVDTDMLESVGFLVKNKELNGIERHFKNRPGAPHIEGPHLYCKPLT